MNGWKVFGEVKKDLQLIMGILKAKKYVLKLQLGIWFLLSELTADIFSLFFLICEGLLSLEDKQFLLCVTVKAEYCYQNSQISQNVDQNSSLTKTFFILT